MPESAERALGSLKKKINYYLTLVFQSSKNFNPVVDSIVLCAAGMWGFKDSPDK